ncbi:ribosomal protein S18-alanine N-acetyltransferase [Vagococcus lutrae]|uniref:ribosomal protein S18-alanine N-acetyltransferase n=1 Tax=Vagococcus lutrae TaxID=81947 RepID=UPI00200D3F10|nr:ribosomal protein S18-alanine N-acetyltransferase [Vagococcus lutrae]UQF72071.1 ribosomal protein S18-alanine N-acetyltransferase [Vagococcus lutrae]
MLRKFKHMTRILAKKDYQIAAQQLQFNQLKGLEIKDVTYTDIKHLIKIQKAVYEGVAPWGRTVFLSELNGIHPTYYQLFRFQETPIGFFGVRFEEKNGHITNVAILSDFQNIGIGSLMLSMIIKKAIEYQCDTLTLEVRKSNLNAKRLYRRFGFESRSIKNRYYVDGEDAVFMEKRLEEL